VARESAVGSGLLSRSARAARALLAWLVWIIGWGALFIGVLALVLPIVPVAARMQSPQLRSIEAFVFSAGFFGLGGFLGALVLAKLVADVPRRSSSIVLLAVLPLCALLFLVLTVRDNLPATLDAMISVYPLFAPVAGLWAGIALGTKLAASVGWSVSNKRIERTPRALS